MDENGAERLGGGRISRRDLLRGTGAAGLGLATALALGSDPVALAAPAPAGRRGAWGVTAFGGGQKEKDDIGDWQTATGRPVRAVRVYINTEPPPVFTSPADFPDDLAAAYQLGLIAIVSYRPVFSGKTGPDNLPSPAQMQADQTAMVKSLRSIVSAGFPAQNLRVSIWHEARSHGVTAAQYLNLYAGVASGGKTNYEALHPIAPVYHIDLGNLAAGDPEIAAYFPGPPTLATNHVDGVCVDWYGGMYVNGRRLQSWEWLADGATPPVGFGIAEFGNSAGGTNPSLSQMVKFLLSGSITIAGVTYLGDPMNSIQAVFEKRLQAGKTNLETIWWQNDGNPTGPNVITSSSDARVPMLQQLHDAISG